MKLEFEHPAFVVAMHKGGRTPRPTVVLRKAEFDLAAVSADEAPLAFRIHRHKGGGNIETRDIRSFGGRLYGAVVTDDRMGRGLPRPQTRDEIIAMAHRNPLHPKGIFFRELEALEEAVNRCEAGTILPSGIKTGLYRRNNPIADDSPLIDACRSMLDVLVMDEQTAATLGDWQNRIQRRLDRYLTVDGAAFEFCGEPIYKIDDRISVFFPAVPDGELRDFTHAAGNHDEAVAKLNALAAERAFKGRRHHYQQCDIEIEVVDPEQVTWRAEEMDFDRYARNVEASLSLGLRRMHEFSTKEKAPKGVYTSWLDLRDYLDAFNPLDGVPDELEHKLADAFTAWMDFRRGRDLGNIYDPEEATFNMMVARFADRAISLPAPGISSFRP